MNAVLPIFKREFAAYFATPLAYVFIVIFLFAMGAFTFYVGRFFDNGIADLSTFFGYHPWLYLFLVPAISMRLWAEERRTGTMELLLTLPVPLWATVAGKYLAAWAFAEASNSPDNLLWMLDNVGWLPNRLGLDYSAILANKPAFGAFVSYPDTYKFFSLPNIGIVSEVLTRTADRLTQAFANPALVGNDAGIMEVLVAMQDEINGLLGREGLLAAE